MNDPKWIIRRASESQPILLANGIDGREYWVAFGFLFPLNEQYPEGIKLAHFATSEEADLVAFKFVFDDVRLTGVLAVELCWIKRCKACYDCLCGEGNRKRG